MVPVPDYGEIDGPRPLVRPTPKRSGHIMWIGCLGGSFKTDTAVSVASRMARLPWAAT